MKSFKKQFVNLFKNSDKHLTDIQEYYSHNNVSEEVLKNVVDFYYQPKQTFTLLWLLNTIEDKNYFSKFYSIYSLINDSNSFQILIDNHIPFNFNLTDNHPLHDAVSNRHVEMVQYLLALNIPYDKEYYSSFITRFDYHMNKEKYYTIVNMFINEGVFPKHNKLLAELIVEDDNLFLLKTFIEDKFDVSYQQHRLLENALYYKSSQCVDFLLTLCPIEKSFHLIFERFELLVEHNEYVYEGFVANLMDSLFRLNLQQEIFNYLTEIKKEDSQLYKSLLFKKLSMIPDNLESKKINSHKI